MATLKNKQEVTRLDKDSRNWNPCTLLLGHTIMQPLCNIWRFIRNYNRIIMQVMIPFLRIHLKKNEKQLSRRYLQTHTNVSRLKEAESCILFAFPVAAPKPDKRSLETEGFVLTLSLWVGRAGQGEWLWVWWQGCGAAATLCLQF